MKKLKYIMVFTILVVFTCLAGGQGRSMSRFMGESTGLDISKDGDTISKDTFKNNDLLEDEELVHTGETQRTVDQTKNKEQGTKSEAKKSGEDEVFMGGDDDEEIEIETDSPEYVSARRKLFLEPMTRLGAKPLMLTIEDCIRIALVNNAKVQATEYGIDAARAQYDEASARFWPIFEYEWLSAPIPQNAANAMASFFSGDMAWWNKFKIGMGLPVYAFGKLTIAKELAKHGISAEREKRKKEHLSTVTQVRQLYYGILLAEELGSLLAKAHGKLSSSLEKKNNDGDHSPVSKIKGRVFLVDLEKRLAEVRDRELLALEGLRIQLGLNPDVSVMVYSTKLRPIKTELQSIEDYKRVALEHRPDVKLVEIGLDARRKQYQLEKRNFLPNIGIGWYFEVARADRTIYGLTTTDNYTNPFNYARSGIGMQMKGKFDGHGQWARVKKAKSEYYKASLEHYMAKDGITLEVKKAHLDAVRAMDDVRRAEKSQKLARQMMFLAQSNYELGVGEEQDYIDSLELVLLTRGRYFESVFNYNVALAILDEKAGIVPVISHEDSLANKENE